MPKKLALSFVAVVLIFANLARAANQPQQQTPPSSKPDRTSVLAEDTPIRVRLSQNLTSATAKVNDKVDFEVIEDVKVGELVVIPQGSTAIGTVTEAHPKRSFGRAGKLNVNIDYVRLANGDKASLRAVKGGSGGSHTGAMTGAVVATAIVFFPAAPLFLFIKGKNIEIPKGTEITAFVAADTMIDSAKFNNGGTSVPVGATQAQQVQTQLGSDMAGLAVVLVKSNPDASDITLDGKFVASTTSTLRLAPGDHIILIEKSGFKPWQRTINVSANGNVTVEATLEKLPD